MARRVTALLAVFALAHGLRQGQKRSGGSCGAQGFPSRAASVAPAPKGNDTNINIVNGQPAKECAWKWQVGLRSATILPASCGGMLIAPDWVLTAAHCIGSGSNPSTNVVAGKYNLYYKNLGEQHRWSKRIIKHPNYNKPRRLANDIALIQLESPMEMTDCVGTVCLPSEGADVAAGSACTITGWGTLSSGGLFQPNQLQEGVVTVLSNEECRATKYNATQITDDMLCAQGQTENGRIVDACQGDSGGPLVCEAAGVWTVYGATSWGRGCAGADYPGVWSRVHHSLDWIAETMASDPQDPPEE